MKPYSVKERYKTFNNLMPLVNDLFYGNIQDDEIQQFTLSLAFEVRKFFKEEWESDWKNDVFLGNLCSLLWRYEDQYNCYKKAYDKLSDPPEALLLLLAGCDNTPDDPPIDQETSKKYLTKALEKKVTYEAAIMMRSFYRHTNDHQEEIFWDKRAKELKQQNIHTEIIIPDVLLT